MGDIRCKDDVFTHLYTLIVNTDGTYEVLIDNESAQKGSLTDDWDFLPPKKIKDPEDTKPEDWEKPEHIADPDATKPEDWDDEMDGEWEPPQIDNPEFKGEWKAKQIDNPDYKVGFLFIAAIQHLMVEIKVLVSISKQLSLSI